MLVDRLVEIVGEEQEFESLRVDGVLDDHLLQDVDEWPPIIMADRS